MLCSLRNQAALGNPGNSAWHGTGVKSTEAQCHLSSLCPVGLKPLAVPLRRCFMMFHGWVGRGPACPGWSGEHVCCAFPVAHFVFAVRESCLNRFYARARQPALHKVQAMLHEGEAMFPSLDVTDAAYIVAFESSWACARLTSVLGTSFLPKQHNSFGREQP